MMVIVGRKGSGKSFLATNFLAIAYKYNLYQEYHLILPEYASDNNDETYNFIKTQGNTYVYTKFDPSIIESVKQKSGQKKILFIMDDATSYLFDAKKSSELLELASTTRHGKGCMFICICHALKNVLIPAVRGLIDHLFIGAFTNANIINHQLWEENASMMMDRDEFFHLYREQIIRHDHNFLYINMKAELDFKVDEWQISNFNERDQLKPSGKPTLVKHDPNLEVKRRIEAKKTRKSLEEELIPKEEKTSDILKIKIAKKKKPNKNIFRI